MIPHLRARWVALLAALGLPEPAGDQPFADLIKAYDGPGRYYHNLDHLEAILAALEVLADQARDRPALELAAWFHDAVYDSHAADNEERSARLAESVCAGWGLPAALGARVGQLIRATRTHEADTDDTDGALLLDADLAILGAEPDAYDRYAAAIRREYAWVPEEEYRRGRARVLEQFLRRERIYQTARMHEALDAHARLNLRREIASLRQGD